MCKEEREEEKEEEDNGEEEEDEECDCEIRREYIQKNFRDLEEMKREKNGKAKQ